MQGKSCSENNSKNPSKGFEPSEGVAAKLFCSMRLMVC